MTVTVKPNASTEKLKTALATQEQPRSIEGLIHASIKELSRALPDHMSADKLARVALTCIRLNPDLAACTPESFLGSLFVLAQLGLSPGVAGQAFLIPFQNKRKVNGEWKSVKEVQALVGYRGLLSLFYRSANSLSMDVKIVYENDLFEFQYGSDAFIKHRPVLKNRGEPVAYYAIAKMRGDASVFFVMSKDECLEHGKAHSKTFDKNAGKFYDSSPWAKEFDAMASKTVIIQLSKLLPLSVEMQTALSVDETSRDFRSGIESALDLPITTSWKTAEDGAAETPEKRAEQAQGDATGAKASPTVQPEPKTDLESFDAFVGK